MAMVNRCAVGIYPSPKLLNWARQLELDVDVAGASEPCLYLIPDYDTQEGAEEIIQELYEAIFEAELDYWHRETATCAGGAHLRGFSEVVRGALLPSDPGPGGRRAHCHRGG